MKTKNIFQENFAPRLFQTTALALASSLLFSLVVTGCASTKVSNRQIHVTEQLPRPAVIWVYDFASTPDNIPADSGLAHAGTNAVPTEEQLMLAQQLGSQIAIELASEIRAMGLESEVAISTTKPAVNDIVIRGYLVSVDQGSAAKRMTIGFGSGNSELGTYVEGYQMTATGLRKLGSGELNASGSKGPGAALGGAAWIVTGSPIGLIVGGGLKVYGEASGNAKIEARAKQTAKEIADLLKERCQAQGWIP
jgi:hypothetical protein